MLTPIVTETRRHGRTIAERSGERVRLKTAARPTSNGSSPQITTRPPAAARIRQSRR